MSLTDEASAVNATPGVERLTVVSGIGGKLPACFLVESASGRLLLDLGEGPEPGVFPDLTHVGRVDAIVLSHAHDDHVRGLGLRRAIGSPPVYATAETWNLLDEDLVGPEDRRLLPDKGHCMIQGIELQTGQSGHAPGGIWMRLGVGKGLLYTGDFTTESLLYPFDPPPPAATIIVDASYGDADVPLDRQIDAWLELCHDGAVFPVPVGGRGPEMAMRLADRGARVPFLGPVLRRQAERIASGGDKTVSPTVRAAMAALLARLPSEPERTGLTICADSDAEEDVPKQLIRRWNGDVPFIFTGHVAPGTFGAALLAAGKAKWQRWNVHPRRGDVVGLCRSVGATRVLAAFVDRAATAQLARDLQPAELVWDRQVVL
jgi:glyoxylase-like metal-dependent hydrolase (beta-lactamase superfamily II)